MILDFLNQGSLLFLFVGMFVTMTYLMRSLAQEADEEKKRKPEKTA